MFLARPTDDSRDPCSLDLRPKDRLELKMVGMTLSQTLKATDHGAGALYLNNDPTDVTAYYGLEVVPGDLITYGIPWFLTDGRVFQAHAKSFTRAARAWVNHYLNHYHLLTNCVHASHDHAIRWLKLVGFNVNPEITEVGGEPTHVFWKFSNTVAPKGGPI